MRRSPVAPPLYGVISYDPVLSLLTYEDAETAAGPAVFTSQIALAFTLAFAGDGFYERLLGLFRLLGLRLTLFWDRGQRDLAVDQLHQHRVAGAELRGQQRFRQRVLDQALDHAPQRAGAVDLVIALLGQEVFGLGGDLQLHLVL